LVFVKPPIFVWHPNNLDSFASAEAAERYIEPHDVDVYEVYDAEGRKLQLETRGEWGFMKEPDVALVDAEQTPTHQEALRRVLVTALGTSISGAAPLEVLVREAAQRFDTTPQAYAPSFGQVLARAGRALRGRRGD
jgi:hypothetical protein